MRFFAIGMLVMILAVFTSPASAQVTTYDCSINSLEGRGFIRDRVIFSVDPTQKVAGVVDDFVMLVYKTPIPADLTILNNGQYRLKWSVDNLRSGADTFDLDYTLTYRPAQKAFNIRTRVKGYDNRPCGSGTCKTVTGQSVLP